MTLFTLGVVTSTFTVDVGTEGDITAAHGSLLPGDIFRQLYAGTELTKFDIIVTQSSDNIIRIESTTMDESTAPNIVVIEGTRFKGENIGIATGEKNTKRGNRSGCPRFLFSASTEVATCKEVVHTILESLSELVREAMSAAQPPTIRSLAGVA